MERAAGSGGWQWEVDHSPLNPHLTDMLESDEVRTQMLKKKWLLFNNKTNKIYIEGHTQAG